MTVEKDNDDLIVKCAAPGSRNKTGRMVSKTQTAGVVGGALIDLGITNMHTGAMWKYQGSITIALDKAS